MGCGSSTVASAADDEAAERQGLGKPRLLTIEDGNNKSSGASMGPSSSVPNVDGRRLTLILWDIENVRLPLATAPGLEPKHIVRYLKKAFIYAAGRQEYRTVCAVTERSLARMRRDHPTFVEQVVPDMAVLLASATHAKRNADVSLKKEFHHFTNEHAHVARACPGQLSVVLLSGDEDFLEPVQAALQLGFDVQLLTHDNASGMLMAQGYRTPPQLWSSFLRTWSGIDDVVLPYGDEQMHEALLRGGAAPRCLVVAGFGAGGGGFGGRGPPRKGGASAEAARAAVVRLVQAWPAAMAEAEAAAAAAAAGAAAAWGLASSAAGPGGHLAALPADVVAAAGAEVLLVEPQIGAYSGSCCVVVRLRPCAGGSGGGGGAAGCTGSPGGGPAVTEGDVLGALGAYLRQQGAGGGGGGGAGGSPWAQQGQGDRGLLVYESRHLLRLSLQATSAPWAPQRHEGVTPPGTPPVPRSEARSAPDDVAPSDPSTPILGAGDGSGTEGDELDESPAPGVGAQGTGGGRRGLHERMQDATEHLVGTLRNYHTRWSTAQRPAGPSPGAGPGARPAPLVVLCQFSQAPGPEELSCTLLVGCASAGADMLHALSHLQAGAGELLHQHGVTLAAESLPASQAAAAAAARGAGGAGTGAECAAPGGRPGPMGQGPGAAGAQAGLAGASTLQRKRLPALMHPYPAEGGATSTGVGGVHAGAGGGHVEGAGGARAVPGAGTQGHGAPGGHTSMAGSTPQEEPGVGAEAGRAEGERAGGAEETASGGKKKKKKKKKNKGRNKGNKNRVVPV